MPLTHRADSTLRRSRKLGRGRRIRPLFPALCRRGSERNGVLNGRVAVSDVVHVQGDALVKRIASAAFPEYKGRQFKIRVATHSLNCASYWDGGSRSYFVFVRLADMKASTQAPAQS